MRLHEVFQPVWLGWNLANPAGNFSPGWDSLHAIANVFIKICSGSRAAISARLTGLKVAMQSALSFATTLRHDSYTMFISSLFFGLFYIWGKRQNLFILSSKQDPFNCQSTLSSSHFYLALWLHSKGCALIDLFPNFPTTVFLRGWLWYWWWWWGRTFSKDTFRLLLV